MFTETSNGENAIILVTMVRCDRRYYVKTSQLMIGYKNISEKILQSPCHVISKTHAYTIDLLSDFGRAIFSHNEVHTNCVLCVRCGWWRSLLKILHPTTTTTHSLPQNGLGNRSRGVVYMRDVCLIMSYDTVSCDIIGKKIDTLCIQILVNSLRRINAVIIV